ncbi:MAG: TIGR04141 family sporadically distributed protein, partial [Pseudomonadales bacterium]
MAKKSFTVFLAKNDVDTFSDILTDRAQANLEKASTRIIEDETFGHGAILYVFVGRSDAPAWLQELRTYFEVPGKIDTRSACAVLVFRTQDRIFAATFAHGWMYLDDSNLETDFGLRVALNALDEKKLKRLDRANLADALRGVNLSSFQRDFKEFGIDDALELVQKVSGGTHNKSSADSLTGAKSLKVTGDYDLDDLPDIAAEALTFFRSTAYRTTSFGIIDVVKPITDLRLIDQLDQRAAENIRTNQDVFELSLPIGYDDDDVGYQFRGPGLRGIFPDLVLRNYTSALGDRLDALDINRLNSDKIIANFADPARPPRHSTIRSALVGSVVYQNGRYA